MRTAQFCQLGSCAEHCECSPAFISLLPDCECSVSLCLQLLPPCLHRQDGPPPQTVSQNNPFLPEAAVRYFVIATRKVSNSKGKGGSLQGYRPLFGCYRELIVVVGWGLGNSLGSWRSLRKFCVSGWGCAGS